MHRIFKDDIIRACEDIVEEYKGSISLHIRRNDFVTNPNHPLQSNQYYMDALEHFPKDLPQWNKQYGMENGRTSKCLCR